MVSEGQPGGHRGTEVSRSPKDTLWFRLGTGGPCREPSAVPALRGAAPRALEGDGGDGGARRERTEWHLNVVEMENSCCNVLPQFVKKKRDGEKGREGKKRAAPRSAAGPLARSPALRFW